MAAEAHDEPRHDPTVPAASSPAAGTVPSNSTAILHQELGPTYSAVKDQSGYWLIRDSRRRGLPGFDESGTVNRDGPRRRSLLLAIGDVRVAYRAGDPEVRESQGPRK